MKYKKIQAFQSDDGNFFESELGAKAYCNNKTLIENFNNSYLEELICYEDFKSLPLQDLKDMRDVLNEVIKDGN